MTVATCPRCGVDLDTFEEFQLGSLRIIRGNIVLWNDQPVILRPSGRLIVSALARADGATIPRHVLADVIGYEGDYSNNILSVQLLHVKRAFKAVDPSFNAIETVWAEGIRWRV